MNPLSHPKTVVGPVLIAVAVVWFFWRARASDSAKPDRVESLCAH
jgi:hypothetical protein